MMGLAIPSSSSRLWVTSSSSASCGEEEEEIGDASQHQMLHQVLRRRCGSIC